MMYGSTQTVSSLIEEIRTCVKDGDLDAARFLRSGLLESDRLDSTWLSSEEEQLLASY